MSSSLSGLTHDYFTSVTPDGRTSIEADLWEKDGVAVSFHGRVVLDGKRDSPLEELKTDDQLRFVRWVRRQMVEALRRSS